MTKPTTVHAIFGPQGDLRSVSWDSSRAWCQFFSYASSQLSGASHALPLSEAIQAYEAIGYRCVKCTLSPLVATVPEPKPEPEPEPSKVREAAHQLWESFFKNCPGAHPYVQSIGTRTEGIVVMLVREPMGHERPIPETWEGWPVETMVVGRIVIGPPED